MHTRVCIPGYPGTVQFLFRPPGGFKLGVRFLKMTQEAPPPLVLPGLVQIIMCWYKLYPELRLFWNFGKHPPPKNSHNSGSTRGTKKGAHGRYAYLPVPVPGKSSYRQ